MESEFKEKTAIRTIVGHEDGLPGKCEVCGFVYTARRIPVPFLPSGWSCSDCAKTEKLR